MNSNRCHLSNKRTTTAYDLGTGETIALSSLSTPRPPLNSFAWSCDYAPAILVQIYLQRTAPIFFVKLARMGDCYVHLGACLMTLKAYEYVHGRPHYLKHCLPATA